MRRALPAIVAVLGVTTAAFAQQTDVQQTDDFALRFNGTSDFVAAPQPAGVVNSFTIDLWVNPTSEHEVDSESLEGFSGMAGQRYAVYPSHGTHLWGWGHAGVGLSVGTNGVSVYEHAGEYIPAVLVYDGAITGWTRVTLVYRDRTPSLYINGRHVRTGTQSPQRVIHPSTGDAHPGRAIGGIGGGTYGYFAGEIDNVRVLSAALTDAEVASPATLARHSGQVVLLDMNRTGAGAGLAVQNLATQTISTEAGRTMAITHGTERTPVFTLRSGTGRAGVIDRERATTSTPLEAVDGITKRSSSAGAPTIR